MSARYSLYLAYHCRAIILSSLFLFFSLLFKKETTRCIYTKTHFYNGERARFLPEFSENISSKFDTFLLTIIFFSYIRISCMYQSLSILSFQKFM